MKLTNNTLDGIEIELSNYCNLRCTGCNRYDRDIKTLNNTELDIDIIKKLINDTSPNFVHLVGTLSEPMMYPNITELLKFLYIKKIRVLISTNASLRNTDFWADIGNYLTSNSEVRFCVDGSTQKIYETYRVGGRLDKVLKNAKSFINNSNCISTLQFLKFNHNDDDINNIKSIYEDYKFNKLYIIPSTELLEDDKMYLNLT